MLAYKGRAHTTEINTLSSILVSNGLMPLDGLPRDNAPTSDQSQREQSLCFSAKQIS